MRRALFALVTGGACAFAICVAACTPGRAANSLPTESQDAISFENDASFDASASLGEPYQPVCKTIQNVWAKSSATGVCLHYADSCTLPSDTVVQTLDEESCKRTTSSCGHVGTEVRRAPPNCNVKICGDDGHWGYTLVGCGPPKNLLDGGLLIQNSDGSWRR